MISGFEYSLEPGFKFYFFYVIVVNDKMLGDFQNIFIHVIIKEAWD